MKPAMPFLLLCLCLLPVSGYSEDVSPKDILSEKYSKELFPEKFEYTQHVEQYKQAVKAKKDILRKLDSLASFDMLPMWPAEEQQRFKRIISLAKNDQSGDVYAYIREQGTEYAFTLNKIIPLNDMYVLERALIKAHNEMEEAEEWAGNIAKVISYFYDDFINKKLQEDIFVYWAVLHVEEQIKNFRKKYNNDVALFILEDEQRARSLYYSWKRNERLVKPTPAKDFLFIQLEKRFTRSFGK